MKKEKIYGVREGWDGEVTIESAPIEKITEKSVFLSSKDTLSSYGHLKQIPLTKVSFFVNEAVKKYILEKEDEIYDLREQIECQEHNIREAIVLLKM